MVVNLPVPFFVVDSTRIPVIQAILYRTSWIHQSLEAETKLVDPTTMGGKTYTNPYWNRKLPSANGAYHIQVLYQLIMRKNHECVQKYTKDVYIVKKNGTSKKQANVSLILTYPKLLWPKSTLLLPARGLWLGAFLVQYQVPLQAWCSSWTIDVLRDLPGIKRKRW